MERINSHRDTPLSAPLLFCGKHPCRETRPSSLWIRWMFEWAINCCSRLFFAFPPSHVISWGQEDPPPPETGWYLSESLRNTSSWQPLSEAWWLDTLPLCQDEQTRGCFDTNMESGFWWSSSVNRFDLQPPRGGLRAPRRSDWVVCLLCYCFVGVDLVSWSTTLISGEFPSASQQHLTRH